MEATQRITPDAPCDERSTRIVAESMFRDLKAYGMPNDRIIEIASQLIGLVTSDLKSTPVPPRRAT